MTLLIDISAFTPYKSITSNADTGKLAQYIFEAQEFDLRQDLGTELYEDLLSDFAASPSLIKYKDLFNGSTYTIPGQNLTPPQTFTHNGLKPILVYYSYARYLQYANIFSTPTGLVTKKDDFSVGISEKAKGALIDQARSGAQAFWARTRKYIIDMKSDPTKFLLYRYPTQQGSGGGIKLNAIGGNTSVRDQVMDRILCSRCGKYCNGNCYGY